MAVDFTKICAIYRSPDGTSLALQNPDGEFVEITQEHGNWVTRGLLEVVPDTWVQLVPRETEQDQLIHEGAEFPKSD